MSAAKTGHRFGIVLAGLPALFGIVAVTFGHTGSDAIPFGIASLVLAAIIYGICAGIGWALS